MLDTYPGEAVTEIRSGMAHGVRMSVVTDIDLLSDDGRTLTAVSA